ncbi:MAG: abortive infection family protein [Dermatophilaceae bacterium]
MARFSKRVIRLLADELTGTVIREIDVLFENNDIPLGPPQPDDDDPGQRRERMRRYLASIDFSSPYDTAKLTRVYSDLMQDIAARGSDQFSDSVAYRDKWVRTLRADGFEVDGEMWIVSDPAGPAIGFTTDALEALSDPTAIHDHLARLGDTVDTDPRAAVSAAKALIESTAKLVLTARGQSYTKAARVPALVNAAQESLGLAAKAVSDEAPALRQVLQSLVTMAQGVAEIRNQVGVDHGAESVPSWVRPRHARLVVGAAQVWCQLMLETLADPVAPWRKPASE